MRCCPCPVTSQSCRLCLQNISPPWCLLCLPPALGQILVESPFNCPPLHSITSLAALGKLSKYISQCAFAHKLDSVFLRGSSRPLYSLVPNHFCCLTSLYSSPSKGSSHISQKDAPAPESVPFKKLSPWFLEARIR